MKWQSHGEKKNLEIGGGRGGENLQMFKTVISWGGKLTRRPKKKGEKRTGKRDKENLESGVPPDWGLKNRWKWGSSKSNGSKKIRGG